MFRAQKFEQDLAKNLGQGIHTHDGPG